MSTTEHEIVEPVDLCTPDGRRLNPAARGWSRRPLHRANLRGGWGRTKRWDYWAILCDDLFVSLTFADVDYLGIVAAEWGDLASGRTGGRVVTRPLARGVRLPDLPGTEPLRFANRNLELAIVDQPDGTHLTAHWAEPRGGGAGEVDVVVAAPAGHESLNVVIPWSDTRFQFTSKHQARPVSGTVSVGGRRHTFGRGAEPVEAWGVLDVGRGRWPYETRWNWGGGAGHAATGEVVGIQIGGRWTAGTGFTENGVLVDGRLVKLGDELTWDYRWDDPMAPWHVTSPDGALDLTLVPRFDRHAKTDVLVLRTEVHQVFGSWSGQVPAPGGGVCRLEGAVGFAEESRSRW